MSYHHSRRRRIRSLGGVSSQPPGPRVANRALVSMAGVSSQPPGLPVARMALAPLNGVALGEDTTLAKPTIEDPAYRTEMLTLQRELVAAQKHWAEGDKTQKWIQIAATIMIPVTAAIWRAIGVGRRRMR